MTVDDDAAADHPPRRREARRRIAERNAQDRRGERNAAPATRYRRRLGNRRRSAVGRTASAARLASAVDARCGSRADRLAAVVDAVGHLPRRHQRGARATPARSRCGGDRRADAGARVSGTGRADARRGSCCCCCSRVLRIGRGRFGQFARLSYVVVFAFTVIARVGVRHRQLPDGDLSAARERRLRTTTCQMDARTPVPDGALHSSKQSTQSSARIEGGRRHGEANAMSTPDETVRGEHSGADRSRRADVAMAQRNVDLGRSGDRRATDRSGAVAAMADAQPSRRSARCCCCCWSRCSAARRCRRPPRCRHGCRRVHRAGRGRAVRRSRPSCRPTRAPTFRAPTCSANSRSG